MKVGEQNNGYSHWVAKIKYAFSMHFCLICVSKMEQHEPEGRVLFQLGSATGLLDVILSNSITHLISPPPIHAMLFTELKILVAKQHPASNHEHTHVVRCMMLFKLCCSFFLSVGGATRCSINRQSGYSL